MDFFIGVMLALFSHFFLVLFSIVFETIFLRFWKGFGGQNAPKIAIFRCFWGTFLGASFLLDFLRIFRGFLKARNLKNRAPVEARAHFLRFRILYVRLQNASKFDPKNDGFWSRKSIKIDKKTL